MRRKKNSSSAEHERRDDDHEQPRVRDRSRRRPSSSPSSSPAAATAWDRCRSRLAPARSSASASPTVTSTWPTWRAYSGRISTTSVSVANSAADDDRRRRTATSHCSFGRRAAGSAGSPHQPAYAADGEERAVREVQHAHQAPDQRQPGGDQEVQRAEPEPGDRAARRTCAHISGSPRAARPRWRRASAGSPMQLLDVAGERRPAPDRARRRRARALCATLRFCSTSRIVVDLGGAPQRVDDVPHDQRREPLGRLVDQQDAGCRR